ncbi:MAG: osmotically inducible protein OsmC [candidate division Zixibacteria bacterium]|nr:osmotically inducible protein OsmC [candidate division Zixibacteria bacterium]
MKAEVRMVKGLSFVAKSDSNHWLALDGPPEFGGAAAASRPLELLLIGLAGCTGMDVVSILTKKRAPLEAFRLEAEATRAAEHPKVFTDIKLTYFLRGEGLKDKDVAEAIRLSRQRYCSASAMLSKACEIYYDYKIE